MIESIGTTANILQRKALQIGQKPLQRTFIKEKTNLAKSGYKKVKQSSFINFLAYF